MGMRAVEGWGSWQLCRAVWEECWVKVIVGTQGPEPQSHSHKPSASTWAKQLPFLPWCSGEAWEFRFLKYLQAVWSQGPLGREVCRPCDCPPQQQGEKAMQPALGRGHRQTRGEMGAKLKLWGFLWVSGAHLHPGLQLQPLCYIRNYYIQLVGQAT